MNPKDLKGLKVEVVDANFQSITIELPNGTKVIIYSTCITDFSCNALPLMHYLVVEDGEGS